MPPPERVTMFNARNHIGRLCKYGRGRGASKTQCFAKILSVSATGNSIKIDDVSGSPRGCLQTVSRAIYIF